MAKGSQALRVVGSHGSPYTRKMLALLRYRRIPHAFLRGDARHPPAGLPATRVPLLPTLYFTSADGGVEAVTDSTPLIRRLEREHAGRAVIPPDPLVGFLDYLVEDYADEWLTRAMFHFRWHYQRDARQAAMMIPLWMDTGLAPDVLQRIGQAFAERQIGRLGVVGSSPATAPAIEASYGRLLRMMDVLLQGGSFLFGARPSAADFALYGQLAQLARIDPTPAALAMELVPRVCAWVDAMEDLSGLEPDGGDWLDRGAAVARMAPLLEEMGRTWLPCLLANGAAIAAGEKQFRTVVDGQPWEQPCFPYQAKCLGWIVDAWRALDAALRAEALELLRESGCAALGPVLGAE